jgi:hypothetical protein
MHIQNVNINLGRSGPLGAAFLAALFAGGLPQPAAVPKPAPAAGILVPPRIGEYWKGQGGIYVGIGRGHEGIPDHHLILATDAKSIFTKRALGTYGVDVTGATSDHNGMANTIALADAGSDLCKEIRSLVIDGHDDFYLMSRTDARLCLANVPEQFEKEWYLTSTHYSSSNAWTQNFDGGFQCYDFKKFEARARAVRRLIL